MSDKQSDPNQDKKQPKRLSNKRSTKKLTGYLVLSVVAMFGFGFALVPLYDVMCEALGINGKTNTVSAVQPQGMQPDYSRTVRVEFMSHIKPDMPWQFSPEVRVLEVHPGEVVQTNYIAKNLSGSSLVGQAVPSVSPGMGATYFNKMECFCFNQQPLDGHKSAEMGLIFYIEPDIPESIHTLTLSYTLFNITNEVGAAANKSEPNVLASN
ncbi:cytochrome c oxidase assembly protein [Vibrio sp. 1CM2L]|uniref:Cytochrome c oxidase assembly protein CtaG n=1 Tax=Vibrio coralliirubri TaxID=1516159 RepID=A0AA86WTM9_9VIBR|nr:MULTISPECIES: cytochrome c oxidase assembly protein [Vibrio]MCK8077742.1 cytochrome c oxidase assembly protein [Vibrio sp. 1CM2L]CDS98772.1 putative Cytochrome c oxidase assembly protein CtaG/Cox11 [Vibrio coralliirubri]CDS98929.1 putative Cytochrome c oxidase assembly protein CtaG/Cox11 [Vibrio coralliirubri]CDT48753.1 putative Cytochrome c oxidase assembly protein CtaG/Cox11 [Vibrio coralliirubri]CDT73609.1 putative Cytochrome c oxidase assembly protein CtaG/Cox11 [Vibrio coralliirubri]